MTRHSVVLGLVLVAAALFAAASQSPAPLAAIALGIMFLVSAIVIFAADMEKLKSFTAAATLTWVS